MRALAFVLIGALLSGSATAEIENEDLRREIRAAIEEGVDYLKSAYPYSGSYAQGYTALATLAMLTAGDSPSSPVTSTCLESILDTRPETVPANYATYAVSLQTMALVAAGPELYTTERYQKRIRENADWLVKAQGRDGAWGYHQGDGDRNDNSNSQYAILGLNAAREAGVVIPETILKLALDYWERMQNADGEWRYLANTTTELSVFPSMTAGGVSSLWILGQCLVASLETLQGDTPQGCGTHAGHKALAKGIKALEKRIPNLPEPKQWLANHPSQYYYYYFMYAVERAARLNGLKTLGIDWYKTGATDLLKLRNKTNGSWDNDVVNTSFAILFLSKGRAPVIIHKLVHDDWANDPNDVTQLTSALSRREKRPLVWQSLDPERSSLEEMLQAPILYLTGHTAPVYSKAAKQKIREFVEQGGYIFAEACCGDERFDKGFRQLMAELFSEEGKELTRLPAEHEIYRGYSTQSQISPTERELYGIEMGCRTSVVYSPQDVSCFWNQMEQRSDHRLVKYCKNLGLNFIDYVTERRLPQDKLATKNVIKFDPDPPQRGRLNFGQLIHAGGWNDARWAIEHLATFLRGPSLKMDVDLHATPIHPGEPKSYFYHPLIYMQGSQSFDLSQKVMVDGMRDHLSTGGTLFANALGGSKAFDESFRQFMGQVLPQSKLELIPPKDRLYSPDMGFDLSNVQYSHGLAKEIGTKKGPPRLEVIKMEKTGGKVEDFNWAVVYSKDDLGCALQKSLRDYMRGYPHASALKISTNVVNYSKLP